MSTTGPALRATARPVSGPPGWSAGQPTSGAVAGSGAATASGSSVVARAAVPPPPGTAGPGSAAGFGGGLAATAAATGATGATGTAAAAGRIRPRRPRPHTGPFTLGQLVCWQLAAATILAAAGRGTMTLLVTATIAVAVVAPTVIRLRGRWLYRWIAIWLRYRTRSRRLPAGGGNPAADLLRFVEDSAELTDVEFDGRPAAAISHRGGLCAVFELDPSDGSVFVGSALHLPSPAALLPAADPAAHPVTVQLLVQVTPAPWASTGRGLVERSYRELTGGDVPTHRRAWLVVQAPRTPDVYSDGALRPVLASALRRTGRQLKQDRLPARTLGRDELLAAIGYLAQLPSDLAGANLYGTASNRTAAQETWQTWWSGETPQVCRRLTRWPELPWHLDDVLRQLPMVATVVSIAVARESTGRPTTVADDDAEIMVTAAVRLSAPDLATLAAGDRALTDTIRERGGSAERIDGEHKYGLALTLPLGGFPR
ncbi:type VII secretion protein EccE [Solwaraspora sp. WMMD406]|uniref:type VII secretion protein EccE n=1 Tax=Solwaraspora sp. WMMD406 TaxID=3016095 RepID=UPI002416993E|nr:type VII secretion protein EccE [Solwaraspora sp. WMMD406]MDG4762763.1 type VII secretion protein EccE [Solwaraspora sp. WMMD406]